MAWQIPRFVSALVAGSVNVTLANGSTQGKGHDREGPKITIVVGAVALLSVGCDESTYSPGYSESAFDQIEIGMSAEEVEALLGEPLSRQGSVPADVWLFGASGSSTSGRGSSHCSETRL